MSLFGKKESLDLNAIIAAVQAAQAQQQAPKAEVPRASGSKYRDDISLEGIYASLGAQLSMIAAQQHSLFDSILGLEKRFDYVQTVIGQLANDLRECVKNDVRAHLEAKAAKRVLTGSTADPYEKKKDDVIPIRGETPE